MATLNVRGVPVIGSLVEERFAAIADSFESSAIDVICFQEVFTYWHLGLLARRMPSFREVSYRRSPVGPAGGLVTFSRLPVTASLYRGFGLPPRVPDVPYLAWIRAGLKGALVTRLSRHGLCIVNTHPVANRDGDWSEENRFFPLHQHQLAGLTRTVRSVAAPTVVCGDFNIDRDSVLFSGFLSETRLTDTFEGRCPPTFHAEYLGSAGPPHCIDFILTSAEVRAETTRLLFAGKRLLRGQVGYLSDHIGLCTGLAWVPG